MLFFVNYFFDYHLTFNIIKRTLNWFYSVFQVVRKATYIFSAFLSYNIITLAKHSPNMLMPLAAQSSRPAIAARQYVGWIAYNLVNEGLDAPAPPPTACSETQQNGCERRSRTAQRFMKIASEQNVAPCICRSIWCWNQILARPRNSYMIIN